MKPEVRILSLSSVATVCIFRSLLLTSDLLTLRLKIAPKPYVVTSLGPEATCESLELK